MKWTSMIWVLLLSVAMSATTFADDLPPCSWKLTVQGQRFVAGQAQDPHARAQAVSINDQIWLNSAGHYVWLTHSEWPGGIVFAYRQFGTPQGGARLDVHKWRDGVWIQRADAKKTKLDHTDHSYLVPRLLLAQLDMRSATGSSDERHHQATDGAGRLVDVTLNSHGQLLSIRHAQARYEYREYPDQLSSSQPQRVQIYRQDQLVADLHVQVQAAELPANYAEIPLPYTDKPEPVALTATRLADGVYRIDGAPSGYHTGFVVGQDGVVVFDAPIDANEAAAIKAVIQRTAPNRSIRYIVVSHSHRDHVGGLLGLVDASTQVLIGQGGEVALRRLFGDRLQQPLQQVTKATQLDLGDRQLAIWPLHSSHARDMLVGADLTSGIVFQGDLFYLPEVGPVPAAFPLTDELVQLLQRRLPTWQQLVGVHGRSATPTDVKLSVQLRAASPQNKPN